MTSYHRTHHRFVLFVAFCTVVLLAAGALVTSQNAGLSVPDWPTSFGSLYKLPPMIGGVQFEHTHRMIAEFIGLLTIVLAIWTWRSEKRSWMRKLGWTALALVVLQGVFGGLTVLFKTPPLVSSIHAALAQTFFALLVLMGIFSGREWLATEPAGLEDSGRVGLRKLSMMVILLLYVQLMTGAAFRHVWTKLGPDGSRQFAPDYIVSHFFLLHALNLVLVAAAVVWVVAYTLRTFGNVPQLRRPAVTLLVLLQVQFGLGFLAYLERVEWGVDAAQPTWGLVVTTAAHLVTGAFMLATAAVLTAQTFRHVAAERRELAPAGAQGASVQ